MSAYAPTPFASPVVNPQTASLFRAAPYISTGGYQSAPTAVSLNALVPGGSEADQQAALADVIRRASDWLDELCFHRADGTLAASPATESGWIVPRENAALALICNYKPILEVDAIGLGLSPANMESLSEEAAKAITVDEPIIWVPTTGSALTAQGGRLGPQAIAGRVWVVWQYVNGYPHTSLANEAKEGESTITVNPSIPGGAAFFGAYPGTQLILHDGANTEGIIVESINGLVVTTQAPLKYTHTPPAAPDALIVTAVPESIEQACISLTSCLIKRRGSRAMVIPQSPGGGSPPKQESSQAGGAQDLATAMKLLKPFIVPVRRST